MEHPITPPPGLVEQWRDEALNSFPDDENPCPCDIDDARDEHIATQAARWGAAQELEACAVWMKIHLHSGSNLSKQLRAARRPRPPSLKEQALKMLAPHSNPVMPGTPEYRLYEPQVDIIRRALESLPDQQD